MSNYTDPKIAEDYLRWTHSENGRIEQDYVLELIRKHLPENKSVKILDAGCGGGWLAGKLSSEYANVSGCDISGPLVAEAKKDFPGVDFQVIDFTKVTPYSDSEFDMLIFNMSAHSMSNQKFAFSEAGRILKSGGKVLLTIPNPYYAYPVGVWKRGLLGFILGFKPKLILRPFFEFVGKDSHFNDKFSSHFYPLSEQLNNALAAGLDLEYMEDVQMKGDSDKFNTKYQLHRFPISLFLVFRKS